MNAVRIRKRLDSDTLHVPELREMIGKDVEIIVLEEPVSESKPPAGVKTIRELAEGIDFDFEAFEKLREISKL